MASSSLNPLPCFVCGEQLSHAWGAADDDGVPVNQPACGQAFEGRPSYGSGFDPGPSCELVVEVAVCDDCLRRRRHRVRVVSRVASIEVQVHPHQEWFGDADG